VELILVSLGFAVCCAVAASVKKRSVIGWFIAGLFFSVIALIIVLILPKLEDEGPAKQCPDCAELIKLEARKCRYCGYEFGPQEVGKEVVIPRKQPKYSPIGIIFSTILGLVLAIVFPVSGYLLVSHLPVSHTLGIWIKWVGALVGFILALIIFLLGLRLSTRTKPN